MLVFWTAISGVVVAALAATLKLANAEFDLRRKRSQLLELLRAELSNLERHCEWAADEAEEYDPMLVANVRIMAYRDDGLFYFDPKESYLLDPTIVQDLMDVVTTARNDGIYIEELVKYVRDGGDAAETLKRYSKIRDRLRSTAKLARSVRRKIESS